MTTNKGVKMNLSKSLRVALAMREKTQTDLANHLGKDRQIISKWAVSGKMSRVSIELTCKYLDMNVSEFVALGEDHDQ